MLSSQEKAAAETFMKNSPSSSLSFESSMQAWHNTLTAGGIKKGNTIILNEALEDLEEGKLSLNSEQVTKFLEYLPQNWKSKITDDIVYNKIPKKDWSKFR